MKLVKKIVWKVAKYYIFSPYTLIYAYRVYKAIK